ncbi:mannose-1-phosphate guanylyltransferase [Glutamicibacter endophyticus]|uniref:mannose-1-phosphate guanylyltransferase n=1 Tax=Glutamicibacter endophyticus TaxID=1522174 RepID=UPI003AF0D420
MNVDPLERFHAVIPAGGVGTRLWPLSRASAPKFLHDLTGTGSTLIRATFDRLVPLASNRIMVITGLAHRGAVVSQLPELSEFDIVLEPAPRDSGAAIGLAAAILWHRDPNIIMGSFAADQVIGHEAAFFEAVKEAVHAAAQGKIVTIGIHPNHPSTGFGYIQTGEDLGIREAPNARSVLKFVEKPDEEIARQYLASGGFLWNAGMFVAPVGLLLSHLRENHPALHDGLMEIARAWNSDTREVVMADIWPTLPKISIDYAVAEPAAVAGDVAVVPGVFDWDDVGDFAAIGRLHRASAEEGTISLGHTDSRVYADRATGVVYSDGPRVIALVGIEDVVVVDVADALLVTTKAHAQKVKNTVEQLKADGATEVL